MAIDPSKLLPAGRSGTPEGTVVQQGTPAGYMAEKQFNSINSSIRSINNNLLGIQKLLSADAAADQQAQQVRQTESVRRADSAKKGKKEDFIESVIQKSIVKPVQAASKKAKSAFQGFFEALTAIFAGWMLDKGGKALKAWQEGDLGTLESIKNNVIKALLAAGGIFLALNGGIPLILGALKAFVGAIMAGIPAIIALLANPATWIAIAAAAGAYVAGQFLADPENAKNEASKEVEKNVDAEGVEKTLEKLEKERKSIEGNWFEYYVKGRGLELERQIEALKKGYKSADDPDQRALGGQAKGDVKANLLPRFAQELVKDKQATEPQLSVLGQLEENYRKLGGIKKAQTGLQGQIDKLNKEGDPNKKLPELKEKLEQTKVTFNQTVEQSTTIANTLSDEQKLALKSLMGASLTKKDGTFPKAESEIQPEQWNKLSQLIKALFPKAKTPEPAVQATIEKVAKAVEPTAEPAAQPTAYGDPISADGFFLRDDGSKMGLHKDDMTEAINAEKALNASGMVKLTKDIPDLKTPDRKPSVNIVPVDMSGGPQPEGDESLFTDNATSIPNIFTTNPNNDYLLHFTNIYGAS